MNIITLTLSPAFDVHCEADELKLEWENTARIIRTDTGGKGVNISRALISASVPSKAVVVLGEENADSFIKGLDADGIDFLPITVGGRIRENITVKTKSGKETRISFVGSATSIDIMAKVEEAVLPISGVGTIITLTGRVPSGIDMERVHRFIDKLHATGCLIVIDSRSFTLSDLVRAHPFLVKPNEEEIASYVGRELTSFEDAIAEADRLRELGIENVMISLGSLGAVLSSKEGSYFVKAPNITPRSTIGAGDSSIAGFVSAVSEGESLLFALRRAVAFGSAACLTEGTLPPKRDDIESFMSILSSDI